MTEKNQLERFKEAARELETDSDEAKFNERLRKMAKQRPDDKKEISNEGHDAAYQPD